MNKMCLLVMVLLVMFSLNLVACSNLESLTDEEKTEYKEVLSKSKQAYKAGEITKDEYNNRIEFLDAVVEEIKEKRKEERKKKKANKEVKKVSKAKYPRIDFGGYAVGEKFIDRGYEEIKFDVVEPEEVMFPNKVPHYEYKIYQPSYSFTIKVLKDTGVIFEISKKYIEDKKTDAKVFVQFLSNSYGLEFKSSINRLNYKVYSAEVNTLTISVFNLSESDVIVMVYDNNILGTAEKEAIKKASENIKL